MEQDQKTSQNQPSSDAQMLSQSEGKMLSAQAKSIFVVGIVILVGIFAVGMKWIFSVSPGNAPFFLFDYAVGLSMIFLPCTLPLAFVIVPLAMGKGYAKGLGIALSFGIGVAITLSFYGALIGAFGQALGIANVELAKNILYAIAGAMAIFFALGEIGLTKMRMPSYSGKIPDFIQKRQDFLKAGLLGLFLGNVGVGCPNPLFNAVVIPQIIASGSIFQGWLIMLVQALGRFTPLLLLSMLGILGVNATKFLVERRGTVERATGWATVFVGGFMLTLGLFTHDWYVYSGIHSLLEKITQEELITNVLGQKVNTLGHTHGLPMGLGLFGQPLWLGSWFMIAVWLVPLWWYWRRKKKEAKAASEVERPALLAKTKWKGIFLGTLSLLFAVVFGYTLPDWFVSKVAPMHKHPDVSASVVGCIAAGPYPLQINVPTSLTFRFLMSGSNCKDPETYKPLKPLDIEHERIMHVLIVKEDFSNFAHIHTEDFGPITQDMLDNSKFTVNYTFPSEGNWRIEAQVSYQGDTVTKTFLLPIGNTSTPVSIVKDLFRDKMFDGYRVTIKPSPIKITAEEQTTITYHLEKDGQPVTDLVPYLGAAAHFAIWSIDQESFAHEHGLVESKQTSSGEYDHVFINTAHAHGDTMEMPANLTNVPPSSFGPDVKLVYAFPHSGLWKIYGQFKHGDQVITTDFMVLVYPSADEMLMLAGHHH